MGGKRRPLPVIEQWYVQLMGEPGEPDVTCPKRFAGQVTGHPDRPDGTNIYTSFVVSMDGMVVTTVSGSMYRLGEPYPMMREYMGLAHPGWDWQRPLEIPPRAF